MPVSARTKRIGLRLAVFAFVALAAALAFDLLVLQGVLQTSLAVLIVCAAVFAAIMVGAGRPFMAALDDRQRSVDYACWYWGGVFGLAFGLLSIVAVFRDDFHRGFHAAVGQLKDFPHGMVLGALLIVAAQVAGYGAAHVIAWSKNRMGAE